MTNIMGKSAFNRKLAVFYGAAKVTGPLLQELLDDAIRAAQHPANKGHGDLSRLTLIIKACQTVKTVPTRTIQKYIQAHVQAHWVKNKETGEYGFKYINGAGATIPDVPWYEWEGNKEKDPVPLDLADSLKRLISRAKSAQKKGKKVVHSELLPEVAELLKKVENAEAA